MHKTDAPSPSTITKIEHQPIKLTDHTQWVTNFKIIVVPSFLGIIYGISLDP